MLASSKYPDKLIHRDLKEQFYDDVIGYFDQGKASQLVTYLLILYCIGQRAKSGIAHQC